MKHLKTYTLFERVSKETKLTEVKNTLNDILSDLSDDEMTYNINGSTSLTIGISIAKIKNRDYIPIKWSDVANSVIHVTRYLKENGYDLSRFQYGVAGGFGTLDISTDTDLSTISPDMVMTSLILIYSINNHVN